MLGWEQLEGLRWAGLTGAGGRVDPPSLVRALPSRGDLVVLSWDRGDLLLLPAEAMAATIEAGRRGRDVVVLDLPRHLDDAAVVALQSADRALVVVPAELRATAAYLVSGGTGSGKTTLLNTLLGLVPGTERIVLVEDAAELRSVHPHVIGLQAHTSSVEGVGAVGLSDLVRQALRLRPDRLVVGECRGAEVVDLLAALNTGHDGGVGSP